MNKNTEPNGKIIFSNIKSLKEYIEALQEILKEYGDMRMTGGVYGTSADEIVYYPEYETKDGRVITQNVEIW